MKGAAPVGLNMSQQLMLELQLINRTLHTIHLTLKEVLYQIDLDWLEKEKKKSLLELLEEEESEKELEEEEGEKPVEEKKKWWRKIQRR